MEKTLSPIKILDRMGHELSAKIAEKDLHHPLIIGIRTGGVWIAQALAQRIHHSEAIDELDINFYRDDFSRAGLNPKVTPSRLMHPMEGRHIILVDDVLSTGRTVRAALNELFDFGRPASILLAVLIDRQGRELPICADVVGEHLHLSNQQNIKLRGPDPLRLDIMTTASS